VCAQPLTKGDALVEKPDPTAGTGGAVSAALRRTDPLHVEGTVLHARHGRAQRPGEELSAERRRGRSPSRDLSSTAILKVCVPEGDYLPCNEALIGSFAFVVLSDGPTGRHVGEIVDARAGRSESAPPHGHDERRCGDMGADPESARILTVMVFGATSIKDLTSLPGATVQVRIGD